MSKNKGIDLTGQRFGRLKILEITDKRQNGSIVWKCMCDCGKEILASSNSLRTGHVLSCGCLRLERLSKAVSKVNKYDLSGEYGIGYTSNTNAKFYFDLEDYDKIKGYCWHEDNDGIYCNSNEDFK